MARGRPGAVRVAVTGGAAGARAARPRPGPLSLAVALGCARTALLGVIGADMRWLAALGRTIVDGGIPDGVPYAGASSAGWANVPVLAELILHGTDAALGD